MGNKQWSITNVQSKKNKATSKNVIPAKAGIHNLLTLLDSRWSLPRTWIRGRSDKLEIIRGSLKTSLSYLLSTVSFFMIVGCQQVQKPEVKGEGPLAVKMARGISAPEFHAPIERWRTTHKKAINRGDFTERECVLCHNPKTSCNHCHKYIAAPEISIPEASLYWPEEKGLVEKR